MLAQTFLATYADENALVKKLKTELGANNHSTYIFSRVIDGINADLQAQTYTRDLIMRVRLAIKLNPYSTDVPHLIDMHNKIMRHLLGSKMPDLVNTIAQCEKLNLPVPVIVSCTKYLEKAKVLAQVFPERYFNIKPIIVRGDSNALVESFIDSVLTLPVNDTYEGLPSKVLEIATFLNAFTTKSGFMKIDDDLTVESSATVDYQKVHDTLKAADYMGVTAHTSFQDRTWHTGKCQQNMPAIYTKPFRVNWPRGPLYFMSHRALQKLAEHYMRFPGSLDGEIYEDKAVAEILYDNQIIATPFTLEKLFGFATENPERFMQ